MSASDDRAPNETNEDDLGKYIGQELMRLDGFRAIGYIMIMVIFGTLTLRMSVFGNKWLDGFTGILFGVNVYWTNKLEAATDRYRQTLDGADLANMPEDTRAVWELFVASGLGLFLGIVLALIFRFAWLMLIIPISINTLIVVIRPIIMALRRK